MPKTEEVRSKRDGLAERLRSRYPDLDTNDDEQLFGRIGDDYDQYDQEIADYKDREGKFASMFTSDPRSARIMIGWKNGEDPAVNLLRLYGNEIMDAINDPEKQDAIAEANREFMERVTKEREYDEAYTSNLSQTLQDLDALQQRHGWSDDQIDSAMDWLIGIAKDAMLGKIPPEVIEMAMKAQNYDKDVAEAAHEGEVLGRNAKIEEKLRKPQKGDGTAHLGGKSGGGGQRQTLPDLGAIDRYADGNQTIYERGGEKRYPIRR